MDVVRDNSEEFLFSSFQEYRVKKIETSEPKLQEFWEILDVDTLGQIVLVTNDYVKRVWNGSFWGYESFDDVGSESKAVYHKQYDHLITNFKFVEPNIVSGSTILIENVSVISVVQPCEHIIFSSGFSIRLIRWT